MRADDLAVRSDALARLEAGVARLPDKPEETVESTLAALWHAACGAPLSAAAAAGRELPPLDAAARTRLEALLARRIAGEPLAHLTGRQRFMGLELESGGEALIPRRETEILGRAAIATLEALSAQVDTPIVIDVCTGSGNVALALAHHAPRARVWGADLSEAAVGLARRNAAALGLSGRVEFRAGDLLAPFDEEAFVGRADLVTCNPPYISTAKVGVMAPEIADHEPRLAFDGGPLGIRILNRLVQEAPRFVRPGGWLAFEVGLGQGRGVRKRVEGHGAWEDVREFPDESGEVRALAARRRATPA